MTSPSEYNDSPLKAGNAADRKHGHTSSFIFYTVQPDDQSIPTICAKLIREHNGHEATKLELDSLIADAYSRNHLVSQKERQIHLGEHLYFKYPLEETAHGKTAARPESTRTAAVKAEEKPMPLAVRQTVHAAHIDEPAPAASGLAREAPHTLSTSACSVFETNVVGAWVERNEVGGRSFAAFTADDNGNGVSVGKMQWNQRKGKLDELLRAFHVANPTKFDAIFGKHAKDALHSEWVRHADFTKGELKSELIQSLTTFPDVQLRLQGDQVQSACGLAQEYQLTALRGVGVIADLVNHVGPNRTRRILQRVPSAEKSSQSQRIDALEKLAKPYSVSRIDSIHATVTEMWKK